MLAVTTVIHGDPDVRSGELVFIGTRVLRLEWYPRLSHGRPDARAPWRRIGLGEGVHGRELDQDISVVNWLRGARSGGSQRSFQQWVDARASAS